MANHQKNEKTDEDDDEDESVVFSSVSLFMDLLTKSSNDQTPKNDRFRLKMRSKKRKKVKKDDNSDDDEMHEIDEIDKKFNYFKDFEKPNRLSDDEKSEETDQQAIHVVEYHIQLLKTLIDSCDHNNLPVKLLCRTGLLEFICRSTFF